MEAGMDRTGQDSDTEIAAKTYIQNPIFFSRDRDLS